MKCHTIMFVCPTHDGRSQMAAALASALYLPFVKVESASLTPRCTHPAAVQVLREIGIDISTMPPRSIARAMLRHPRFDSIVSLDREVHEHQLPSNLVYESRLLWDFPPVAPEGLNAMEILDHARSLRDRILGHILHWGDGVGLPPRDDISEALFARAMHMAAAHGN